MRLVAFFSTLSLLTLSGLSGCRLPEALREPRRLAFGRVLVLPGIEGGTVLSRNVALGLNDGGVRSAIENFDWTVGVPGAFAYNLVNYERNQRVARELAGEIVRYRNAHPGRPIHIVGHSGGAGIIVFALESLPDDVVIDQAILLGVALSPDYNLAPALKHVSAMISFYSRRDVALLQLGTTAAGTMDREHGVSAGAVGFTPPIGLAPQERQLYATRLRQIGWNDRMSEFGAPGTHIGWARRGFARKFLSPIVTRNEARYLSQEKPFEPEPARVPAQSQPAPPPPQLSQPKG